MGKQQKTHQWLFSSCVIKDIKMPHRTYYWGDKINSYENKQRTIHCKMLKKLWRKGMIRMRVTRSRASNRLRQRREWSRGKILSTGKWKIVIVPSLARLEQIKYGEEVRKTSSKGRLVLDQKILEVIYKRICIWCDWARELYYWIQKREIIWSKWNLRIISVAITK